MKLASTRQGLDSQHDALRFADARGRLGSEQAALVGLWGEAAAAVVAVKGTAGAVRTVDSSPVPGKGVENEDRTGFTLHEDFVRVGRSRILHTIARIHAKEV